jgi:hypothetical protein
MDVLARLAGPASGENRIFFTQSGDCCADTVGIPRSIRSSGGPRRTTW